uniref:Uncharacterized protein n=1 Tax=Helianthus annuus TaxID=4232 RepID=A0A251TIF4_HELAN
MKNKECRKLQFGRPGDVRPSSGDAQPSGHSGIISHTNEHPFPSSTSIFCPCTNIVREREMRPKYVIGV